MLYEELEQDIERIISFIYAKEFSGRWYMKDDLMQEARITIWKFIHKTELSKMDIIPLLPLYVRHAMMMYLNKRFHLRTKDGYAEVGTDGILDINIRSFDDTLRILLLLYDIQLTIKKVLRKVWDKEKYYKLAIYLLMGYTHAEIGEFLDWHENNVYFKKQLLGKSLLKGLEYEG